jgi:hypothetical protein
MKIFETIKDLRTGDQLTIDDDEARQFTHQEDYEVSGVRILSQDEGEVVYVHLGGVATLVAHTLGGDPRFYLYEHNFHGPVEDMENEGMIILDDDNDFRQRGKLKTGTNKSITLRCGHGPVYDLTNDNDCDDVVSVCEYRSSCKVYPFMLVEVASDTVSVFQGIRIAHTSLVV